MMKRLYLFVLGIGLLVLSCAICHADQNQGENLIVLTKTNEDFTTQLQDSFSQFPLLNLLTDQFGQPVFQTLSFTNPVIIGGSNYYGFRFQVPQRTNNEDFVWAFVEPQMRLNWYIMPQTGGVMMGFTHYNIVPKDYLLSDRLFPLNGVNLYLQSLSGKLIQDGDIYLIWMRFRKDVPKQLSLTFTFASQVANNTNEAVVIEDVLALKHPLLSPSKATSDSGVKIISARYGSGAHHTNVTDRVSELLAQPDVVFLAKPKWLKADPTPGWN